MLGSSVHAGLQTTSKCTWTVPVSECVGAVLVKLIKAWFYQ